MLIKQFNEFIQKHNLLPCNAKVVLGLSGGPDSVFLLHYLAKLQKKGTISLIVAHLDHKWRPDSHKDELFCREITQNLGITFVSKKISELTIKVKPNGSQEEFGRIMRRHFLETVMKEHQANTIALAHHLQDQEETFLIRLIRGATLTGLTAMQSKYGPYIRPLLEINKENIIAYLKKHTIAYITDPSNELPTFLRNRIRATVLPALRACDKRFDHNFLITLRRLKNTEEFLKQITTQTFASILEINENREIDLKKFLDQQPIMQYRIIMHWLQNENVPFSPTQSFLDEIIRFLQQPEGKNHEINKAWSIVKKKNKVHIEKLVTEKVNIEVN